jgi:predicted RNA-binding Zn-ribbon protein involved in translation (DUF1610 family)
MESKYRFVSNRVIKNSKNEDKGKMRVLVPNGSETAQVDYVCPECGNSHHEETPWQRPFSLKCSKCGFILKLPRLKDEIKKDKKQAKAEMEAKTQAEMR